MFREIIEYVAYKIKELAILRILPLIIIVAAMFIVLSVHLYNLQIVEGAEAQDAYVSQKTLRTVSTSSTRGNIYDRNGNLLAYNKLVYSVSITDTGDYNGYQKNKMILRLLEILDKRGDEIVTELPLYIDAQGTVQYSVTGNDILRALRDVYGKKSIQEVIDDEDCDENLSAEGMYELLYERYGIGLEGSGSNARTYDVSKSDALRVINVRYLLATNYYQRYKSVIVAKDIGEETMTDILEHSGSLLGVDIEEEYTRVYNDSVYFAHIIGYTGTASVDDLERLNADYAEGEERYASGDIVGKTGIEASMEDELQGIKGSKTMYLDSLGRILETVEEVNPQTGNDIYLTIDRNIQIGIYHLIEQNLAGIIVDKLQNSKVYNPAGASASNRKLSIYEAYYQMINNNILDMSSFATAQEGTAQARIYQSFLAGQADAYDQIKAELLSETPTAYKDLGGEIEEGDENFMKIYFSYVYEILSDAGYLRTELIDKNDATYIAYKTDETISPSEFFKYALSMNWIDISKLELSGNYTGADETYYALVEKIDELLKSSSVFSKRIYKNLIYNMKVSGCDICLALIEQGVVTKNESDVVKLEAQNSVSAYEFMISKIKALEITPAMLAMDPCSAAVTLVDIYTGDTIACVSYPSYDNNRLSGSVDTQYYSSLVYDLSAPLYNSATQAQKAPGSVFKLVTTAAALEEGVISSEDIVDTEGVFTKQGLNLKCSYYSIYHEPHGKINIVDAIAQSCNYFFCEMGWRLSQKLDSETGEYVYNEYLGIDTLNKYATELGLSTTTGIELSENEPQISDTAPIPSAIGQGTNLFSNVQLARYSATLANGGSVNELTLIKKICSSDGSLLSDPETKQVRTASLSDDTWNTIKAGMRAVVTKNSGTMKNVTCSVEIAGKTGTAEENKLRPSHANFISYAPYTNPEISCATTIFNGYTASNSVKLTSEIYDLYYGVLTLDEILSRGASQASTTVIID